MGRSLNIKSINGQIGEDAIVNFNTRLNSNSKNSISLDYLEMPHNMPHIIFPKILYFSQKKDPVWGLAVS